MNMTLRWRTAASQALSTYRRSAVPLIRLLATHTCLSAILATIPKEGSQIKNGINCVKVPLVDGVLHTG